MASQRAAFVRAVLARTDSVIHLCRAFGVARPTGYRWLRRYEAEGHGGLSTRRSGARTIQRSARRVRWEKALLALRRAHPHWGPRKLRASLQKRQPGARLPSVRTIGTMLQEEGLILRPRRRSPRGPAVRGPARTEARRCHGVWTVDFKGDIRLRDGRRCRPLTVRDLFSRYLLVVAALPRTTGCEVRRVMERCFRRHGLPRVIRVDNGPPFGRTGALGLSQLSVWWWRLGIQVEFTRPAHPQDNGAHEQMHRVLQAETARPPAAHWAQQVNRLRRFRHYYNTQRPHEALGQRTPQELYRVNGHRYAPPAPLRYPAHWITFLVGTNGKIYWAGRQRRIGEAFAAECIALKAKTPARGRPQGEVMEVYWGRQLIGELHRQDTTDLRPAYWQRSRKD
jgi:transposase InsO family protein